MNEVVEEVKRNRTLLEEIEAATEFRIAYQHPTTGEWIRLLTSNNELKALASLVVEDRIKVLVPSLIEAVVNKTLDELCAELNGTVEG